MFTLLDESLGFVVNKTALALKNELEKRLKPIGITAVQFAVMKRLWEADDISQKELADRTFKKTAEMTYVIDKLEKRGLLVRLPKANDRREYRIVLTDAGRAIEADALEAAYATLEKAQRGLEDGEVRRLLGAMETIYANLTQA